MGISDTAHKCNAIQIQNCLFSFNVLRSKRIIGSQKYNVLNKLCRKKIFNYSLASVAAKNFHIRQMARASPARLRRFSLLSSRVLLQLSNELPPLIREVTTHCTPLHLPLAHYCQLTHNLLKWQNRIRIWFNRHTAYCVSEIYVQLSNLRNTNLFFSPNIQILLLHTAIFQNPCSPPWRYGSGGKVSWADTAVSEVRSGSAARINKVLYLFRVWIKGST